MADSPDSVTSHKGQSLHSYTVAFKLKVVNFAKENNNSRAARLFDVDRKRVIDWRKSEQHLISIEEKNKRKRLSGGGIKITDIDIEERLKLWIQKRRETGAKLTGMAVKMECKRLISEKGNQSFKASCGWLRRFMKRNKLSF